ncbi:hypothetical protein NDU88_005681 [Pleurodeles waltl]|uniref:Uncharacterized protein n=1 Tax=Pleurodeles waltl TaxID=8319 RepID=A0AAV7LLW1_PLEWA|nr:hypothetical protein NDU88_005681 [Pleurodeles waltl]
MQQAHRIAGSHNRHDKTLLPLKEKQERMCYCYGLEYPHIGAWLAWDTNAGKAIATTILQASAWVDTSRRIEGDLPDQE